jgi:hypothetical protein
VRHGRNPFHLPESFSVRFDSVNFVLGIDHFAAALHQPHPTGYYLYVSAARAIKTIFRDANASLVAISMAKLR